MLKALHNFKLIAFDLDGTLLNTVPDLTLSINITFAKYSLPKVDELQVSSWVGNGMRKLIERSLLSSNRNISDETFNSIFNDFNNVYAQNNCNKSQLYPNVISTLEYLHKNNFMLAIITNKASQYLQPILQHYSIEQYFSCYIGDGDLPKIKPHPAPIFYLCGKYGLYPKEILFVGDSNNDVLVAKNSGCFVLGLTYGYNYNESITTYDPDWVSDDIKDVLKIIQE